MKSNLLATCVLLGTVLAPIPGYSADGDADRSNPKAYVKDSVITTKIKAEYAKDKEVSMLHIKVDTDANGTVKLSGNAKTQGEADKAELIARGVEGVKSVSSDIKVTGER